MHNRTECQYQQHTPVNTPVSGMAAVGLCTIQLSCCIKDSAMAWPRCDTTTFSALSSVTTSAGSFLALISSSWKVDADVSCWSISCWTVRRDNGCTSSNIFVFSKSEGSNNNRHSNHTILQSLDQIHSVYQLCMLIEQIKFNKKRSKTI